MIPQNTNINNVLPWRFKGEAIGTPEERSISRQFLSRCQVLNTYSVRFETGVKSTNVGLESGS